MFTSTAAEVSGEGMSAGCGSIGAGGFFPMLVLLWFRGALVGAELGRAHEFWEPLPPLWVTLPSSSESGMSQTVGVILSPLQTSWELSSGRRELNQLGEISVFTFLSTRTDDKNHL